MRRYFVLIKFRMAKHFNFFNEIFIKMQIFFRINELSTALNALIFIVTKLHFLYRILNRKSKQTKRFYNKLPSFNRLTLDLSLFLILNHHLTHLNQLKNFHFSLRISA